MSKLSKIISYKDNFICHNYRGNSMNPTFQKGDLLYLKSVSTDNLFIGDIVVFRNKRKINSSEMIVHRITTISNGYLYTQGDNNKKPDIIPIFYDNLLGKIVAYERKGKKHWVIGGMPGLIIARIRYFFRRSAYLFFTKTKCIFSKKIISDNINRFWRDRIQKIKVNTNEGPVIKWIFRNRTLFQQLPDNTLHRFSVLSYFLTETKNPDFPPNSSNG